MAKYDAFLLPVQLRGNEQIDEECIILVGIDELSVLAVILHACAHAAPHRLVRCRVVAVVARTGRGKVYVPPVHGVLAGENVVEGSQFVVVCIACLGVAAVQVFCQLEHVVGVAGLRTVDVVDEVHAGLLAGEVLAPAVATKGQRPFTSDDVPEETGGFVVRLGIRRATDSLPVLGNSTGLEGIKVGQLGYTLKAHYLGHLRVGVHVVEAVLTLRHWCEQPAV